MKSVWLNSGKIQVRRMQTRPDVENLFLEATEYTKGLLALYARWQLHHDFSPSEDQLENAMNAANAAFMSELQRNLKEVKK